MKALISRPALAATVVFGAAMVPAMAVCSSYGAGTLTFELAGTSAKAAAIIAGWGSVGRSAAHWQLVLDLGFIAGYAGLLAAACLRRGRQLDGRPAALAWVFAATGIAAGACDLAQNVALWLELDGHIGQPGPAIARFALFGIGICVLAVLGYLVATWPLVRKAPAAA